ncbi:hypothetical protein FCL40_15265 [Ferrimonas sediminicola]|uniref:Uncharacterized protein n=1 Tax=Ferrimonas sediminicola TaxID=2569538 RepID=A0A4U1B9V3_9GAMM|nr:hypothetical protein [Ferrimonas sediminicola]TKB47572.1 hypothetical protein FCL40_15265 [Ferrimonas sediminicola]
MRREAKQLLFPHLERQVQEQISTKDLSALEQTGMFTKEQLERCFFYNQPSAYMLIMNMLVQLRSLPNQSFDNTPQDEFELLNTRSLQDKAQRLFDKCWLINRQLSDRPEALEMVELALTESFEFGSIIGEYNELVSSLPTLRKHKKYQEQRSLGGQKKNAENHITKSIIADIIEQLGTDPFLDTASTRLKAESIRKLIDHHRQKVPSIETFQKYIKEVSGRPSKIGAPRANSPKSADLDKWLSDNFNEKIPEYFRQI